MAGGSATSSGTSHDPPGAARTQLTFFPDRVTSAHHDPVAGNHFVFSKDTPNRTAAICAALSMATSAIQDARVHGTHWAGQKDPRVPMSESQQMVENRVFAETLNTLLNDLKALTKEGGGALVDQRRAL